MGIYRKDRRANLGGGGFLGREIKRIRQRLNYSATCSLAFCDFIFLSALNLFIETWIFSFLGTLKNFLLFQHKVKDNRYMGRSFRLYFMFYVFCLPVSLGFFF